MCTKVYAHETFKAEFDAVLNGRAPGYFYRGVHQFGLMLPEDKASIVSVKKLQVHLSPIFVLQYIYII